MAATTTTDRVAEILTALNTIDGIDFAEDAWEEKAPSNYGVLELTGESGNDYADGRKTAINYAATLTIYVKGGSHHWIEAVEDVLDAEHIPHNMPQREFLMDIRMVKWTWRLRIRKKIKVVEVETGTTGTETGPNTAATETEPTGGEGNG